MIKDIEPSYRVSQGRVLPAQIERAIYYSAQSSFRTHGIGNIDIHPYTFSGKKTSYDIAFDSSRTHNFFSSIIETVIWPKQNNPMSELAQLTKIPFTIDKLATWIKGEQIENGETDEEADTLHFHPTILGVGPGTPLTEYFRPRLPTDLSPVRFARLSNLGYARLILEELGGKEKAKIMSLPDAYTAHSYVIPVDANPHSYAYNNNLTDAQQPVTVGEVRMKGKDITDIINAPWSVL